MPLDPTSRPPLQSDTSPANGQYLGKDLRLFLHSAAILNIDPQIRISSGSPTQSEGEEEEAEEIEEDKDKAWKKKKKK